MEWIPSFLSFPQLLLLLLLLSIFGGYKLPGNQLLLLLSLLQLYSNKKPFHLSSIIYPPHYLSCLTNLLLNPQIYYYLFI
jgi:ABC-type dipeptide/oligopeptide/nickel transport system permease subunit